MNDAVHLVYGLGVSVGPDCNVIAEQGGGPDARPSWAGSGPRAGGCPPMNYCSPIRGYMAICGGIQEGMERGRQGPIGEWKNGCSDRGRCGERGIRGEGDGGRDEGDGGREGREGGMRATEGGRGGMEGGIRGREGGRGGGWRVGGREGGREGGSERASERASE